MTQLYKKNGLVFIPAGITVEEVEKLKKENTELKTRWQCRNKYMCNENGKAVPCYIYIYITVAQIVNFHLKKK